MKDVTIDACFVAMLLEGAQQQGLECDPILLRNGISRLALSKRGTRVPLKSFAAFAIEIMKTLDDECLGLTHRKQRLGSFNMMCRSCISARNIRRSLKRAAKFWNLFQNGYQHDVLIDGEQISYTLSPIDGQRPLNNYLAEAILSSIHRFHCWLGGQFIPLDHVAFEHAEPEYADQYRPLFYGAPISYDDEVCSMTFPLRFLDLEIVQTPETLDQYLRGTNLSLLYQPKNYRVIGDQVRQWLERNIKQGNYKATLREAATHFQMSQQVLHRRLQAEELSFKEIKMQTRRDLAVNLLFQNKYKIEEIATLVGFSEPSAFIRAFKAWTGSTPLAYRQTRR
ncbi:AraC family transcriptional regulator [Arenicella xantha]|uniref:AraC family transcriptional regulator n=1 Tax=Arenicella xantha TaxID=644221 RepID=A0A395JHC8_9GAMM|nr:AraC family transcriptional regulator [Arenicella xantha]RBP49370.1 AraC family transcriptional regulator [Arenicella xantha]